MIDYITKQDTRNYKHCSAHCLDFSMKSLRTYGNNSSGKLGDQEQNCLKQCHSKLTNASDLFL